MREFFDVTVQPDDEPHTRVEPRTVEYDTLPEAVAAIERALHALVPGATVTVSREIADDAPGKDDPDLDDWPAPRHIHTQSP